MNDYPHIFAFYSFKGGVGRSMAVLNVGYALAARGRNVLVLDMDLEAPGLSGFLRRHQEIERFSDRDMVDLIQWAKTTPVSAEGSAGLPGSLVFPPLTDFVVTIPRANLEKIPRKFSEIGRLDVIPVEEERDYYDRLTGLGMGNLDQDALVRMGSVLRAWLRSLRFPVEVPDYYGPNAERTAAYDYILVDSRTGISETGGLCIGPLSDQLVVLTALNDQNVEGTRRFLEEVGILEAPSTQPPTGTVQRSDAKPTHIVASLVPVGEIETKRNRLERLEQALGKTVVRLSYHPQMALMETIFTRDHRDENLAREYEILLRHILRSAHDGEIEVPEESSETRFKPTPESRDAMQRLLRKTQVDSEGIVLWYHLEKFDPAVITEESDFILWDKICRTLSGGESSIRFPALNVWANLLAEWGLRSKETNLASRRFFESESKYSTVLKATDSPTSQKARALFNRSLAYRKRREWQKSLSDCAAVLAMPDAPTTYRIRALINRGGVYGELGERQKALDDCAAVLATPDAPPEQRAAALILRSWECYQTNQIAEAIVDVRSAISIKPDDWRPHANLGVFLLVQGQPDDALAEYEQALALAEIGNLEELTTDLQEAMARNPGLSGTKEVMAQVEKRKAKDTQDSMPGRLTAPAPP